MNKSTMDSKQGLNAAQHVGVGLMILAGLFVVSRYNFLLFHGLAELFSIAVAWSVFFLAWNTRRIARNDALVFLGVAYLFVGLIDLVHTLSYKGMGVFADDLGANYATQLWIGARGLEAISLLLFPLLMGRRIRFRFVFGVYGGITALMMAAIFLWGVFPACYVEGRGLTAFKKTSEYMICLTLAGAIALLYGKRERLDAMVFRLMAGALGISIVAELCFTFYISVFGLSNIIGHFLKIISFFLVYMALVRSALTRPYDTLFRDLEKEKAALVESEESARKKIQAVLEPEGDLGDLNLADIIDHRAVQSMMEDFYKVTKIGSAVLDLSGKVLVAVGWQDICTKFHRRHPDTLKNCLESDTILSKGVPAGEFKAYRCKNNLWDMVTSIEVDGRHLGNIFIGQFFYGDEAPDYDLFRNQARRHGFDEKKYIAALDRVPRWRRETVETTMTFFAKLSGMISSLGYGAVNLARAISRQEAALRRLGESEAKLRQAQYIAGMGDFTWDMAADAVAWSDGMYDLLKYDKTEIIDLEKVNADIHHPDDLERVTKWLKDGMASGAEFLIPNEYRLMRKDGRVIHVQTNGQIEYQNGKAVKLFGTCLDITGRKQAQDALNQSKMFLENLNDIAYMADDQGNLTWVNAAVEEIVGFSAEEVMGKPFLPLVVAEDHASLIQVYERTLMGESLENIFTFLSGAACHFTSLPRRNMAGEIVGTFGIARDITRKLQTEKALRDSEERLRKAQQAAKIGNWEYDISTGKVWGSEEVFRIYGIERKTEFFPLEEIENHIIDAKRVNRALTDLIAKNEPYDIEFEIKPKDGKPLTVIRSIAELGRDANGNPVKVLGVIQDITTAKAKERENIKLIGQLQHAQKMESIGRLAGGVAHDFNNMLTVILGHVEMALEETDPARPLHARLEEIRNAGERSTDLVRQLLAFARKQTIAPRVLDLNKTVEGMFKMLQRLIGEDIALNWRPGKDLGPVKVDPSQVDQILANLCVNARDAIKNTGNLTIETVNAAFDEAYCGGHAGVVSGEYVLLTVSDDGCGMDAEIRDKLFEPFFTTKELGKGTGLGLATVYGIVKQNNGFINVYSEPGRGTTFKIYLPRHEGEPGRMQEKSPAAPAARGHETILLVEDEPAILAMVKMMLERLGYTVLAAGAPGETIRLAGEYAGEIHLLMTDVVMPEMNGLDLAENLFSLYPKLNCLFMSGYTADVIARHGVLDEGVNFIQKPFSMKDLAFKVREALDGE
ncbi:MAG: PAS domain S-box protein [Deltaproteobacteria bacterium]|nr:PAS domain S-box protein [Deltaproteobacteria bacterium]